MKNLIIGSILVLGLSSQALAVTSFPVDCQGRYTSESNMPMAITVVTNPSTEQLEINTYSLISKVRAMPREFQVTQTRLMFPVSSIEAVSDFRRVDGDLAKAVLAIHTEVIAPASNYPAKLTLDTLYDGRGGRRTTHNVYDLTCTLGSQN